MDGSAVTLHLVELTFFKNRFLTSTWPEFSESFGATVCSFIAYIIVISPYHCITVVR